MLLASQEQYTFLTFFIGKIKTLERAVFIEQEGNGPVFVFPEHRHSLCIKDEGAAYAFLQGIGNPL